MEGKRKKVSDYVVAELDEGIYVFENNRGMNINGCHTIHMANWKIQDIEAILLFLKIHGEKGGDAMSENKINTKDFIPKGYRK